MKLSSIKNVHYSESWPAREYYIHELTLDKKVVSDFRDLIEKKASETEIDKYISKHPVLLTAILDFNNTGHHAAWVIPKQSIRPRISKETSGLIPDFIIGGKNSFGITWYIVELKGSEHKLFSKKGGNLLLSSVANRGVCQILEYMHFCNKSQAILRDVMKFSEFVSADAFLFIGRSEETESMREKDLKSALNNINKNLQIRSYDALLNRCEKIVSNN